MLGVFYGYLSFSLGSRISGRRARDALLLALLGCWVFVCCFVKASSIRNGYSGFVAAFSAAILLTGMDCGGIGQPSCANDQPSEIGLSFLALSRLQMTLAGIVALIVTSVLVFPVDTSALVYHRLSEAICSTGLLFKKTQRAWIDRALATESGEALSSDLIGRISPRTEGSSMPACMSSSGLSNEETREEGLHQHDSEAAGEASEGSELSADPTTSEEQLMGDVARRARHRSRAAFREDWRVMLRTQGGSMHASRGPKVRCVSVHSSGLDKCVCCDAPFSIKCKLSVGSVRSCLSWQSAG